MRTLLALALLFIAPITTTQTITLTEQQDPGVWHATLQEAPSLTSVQINIGGRNAWSFCATNNSGAPQAYSFTEPQSLTFQVSKPGAGTLQLDVTGETAVARLRLAPSGTDCRNGIAMLFYTITLTDPASLAFFEGTGTSDVTVLWNVDPTVTGNGNEMDQESASFLGEIRVIEQ